MLKKLSQTTTMMLTTMAALQVPGIWFFAQQYSLAMEGITDEAAAMDLKHMMDALALLEMGVRLAAAVVFVRWMLTAHRHAMQWAPDRLRHNETRVLFSFFIPFLNLFWPFQAMLDIWKASQSEGRFYPPILVQRWWTLWVGATVLNAFGIYVAFGKPPIPPEKLADQALFLIGSRATLIPCALIAVKMVKTLTLIQLNHPQYSPPARTG